MKVDPGVVARLRSAGCVFAEDEAALLTSAARSAGELAAMVDRRVGGEPLEQVVGWAEFRRLRIFVDPGVFVPRRRSEFLVSVAVSLWSGAGSRAPVIVDLCCGTGALGLAVAAAAGGAAELHAADLDPAAVACARRNVSPAGGRVYLGDLFEALPSSLRGRIDLLICNAPYVPSAEVPFLPAEARDHEALLALDGGRDGLAVLRRVAAAAPAWLALGGVLLVETSEAQAPSMAEAMGAAGLSATVHTDEEYGATVVTGERFAALFPFRPRRASVVDCAIGYAPATPNAQTSPLVGRAGGRDNGGMRLRVDAEQRRGRLAARHRLGAADGNVAGGNVDGGTVADGNFADGTVAGGNVDGGTTAGGKFAGGTVADAVHALVALHATDPVSVYLSAWARTGCTVEHVDDAIYHERAVVRMLGMRRTVFVVPAGLVGVVQAACTDDVAKRERRRLEKHLADGGIGDGDAAGWLRSVETGVLRALATRGGGASGAQLSQDEPRLRTQLVYATDKAYGGPANITSRVLGLLAADGHLVRGHRRGGWASGQFEWFLAADWLAGDGAERKRAGRAETPGTVPDHDLDAGRARAELARRWLRAFGPALPSDLRWWAGWTGAQTKAALGALPVAEVDLDGQAGVMLADDPDFAAEAPPTAALLPALDPTPMGWQSRSWYLGAHARALFDRTGNVGPTVWWQGRVVGGWAQRSSGEVVFRLLEDIGADGEAAVSATAARLEAWLGPWRVTPRFRTPLERELSA